MESFTDRQGLTPRQRRKFAVCKKHGKAYCGKRECAKVRTKALKKRGIAIALPAIGTKRKGNKK